MEEAKSNQVPEDSHCQRENNSFWKISSGTEDDESLFGGIIIERQRSVAVRVHPWSVFDSTRVDSPLGSSFRYCGSRRRRRRSEHLTLSLGSSGCAGRRWRSGASGLSRQKTIEEVRQGALIRCVSTTCRCWTLNTRRTLSISSFHHQ